MDESSKRKFLVTVVIIALSFSSFTVFSETATADILNTQLGDFSFSYDNTTSTLYNLNYSNANYTMNVANSVMTAGQHANSPHFGKGLTTTSLQLNNVTITSTEDNDSLLMSTTNSAPSQIPSVTLNLSQSAVALPLTPEQKISILKNCNSVMASFVQNTIYMVNLTDGHIFYFSNAPSTISNSGKTIVFQNSSFNPGSSLIVGTTPSGTIKYSLDKQKINYNLSRDPLSFDPSTGDITGTYLSLNFNSTTGVISDYTNKYTNTKVFDQIYSTGNGSIGDGFISPLFPSVDPLVIGNVFYFANNTAIYQAHNNRATVGNFFIDNGTAFFKVNPSLSISTFTPNQKALGPKHKYGYNYSNFSNLDLGNQFMVQAGPTIITVSNGTFNGQLFVHEGTVNISGKTISISSSGITHVTFVAQVLFLQAQLQIRNQLQYAIQHGKLGAMVSVGPNGPTGANMTTYYNSSMQLRVQNMVANKFQIQVESQMQHGNSFAIFIPNEVIQNNLQFTLKYDNQQMTMVNNMNSVLNSTNQNNATYYMAQVSGGTLVVVNVPHFTTHTLEISATSAGGGFNLWLYVIVVLVVVAAAGITAFIFVRRGRKP